jgi:hypothetical protein
MFSILKWSKLGATYLLKDVILGNLPNNLNKSLLYKGRLLFSKKDENMFALYFKG